MQQLLCFLCIVMLNLQAYAKDYYISKKGNDTNVGSREKPWRSLAKVNITVFNPGDRIYFAGGDTFEGSLILHPESRSNASQPITIASSGKGKAIILAGTGDGILVSNKGGIIIRDLIVKGADRTQNHGYGIKVINDLSGNSRLDFVRIEQVEASRFRWAGIYVGGVPTDLPGMQAPEGSRYGFKDVRIEKCAAFDNMYYGIYVSAAWNISKENYGNEDVHIIDCETYDNAGDPAYTENHSGSGIMLDDTNRGSIEYCVAYNNGALNAGKTGGPIGIWTHASDSILIQYCLSYANRTGGVADGGGFDLDAGVTHSVIQYCYSHDNDGAGYLMWNYEGAPHELSNNVIRYCISENDSRKHKYGAIHIGTSGLPVKDMDVYHNTIIMSEAKDAQPKGIWTGAWGSKASNENLHFFNNLIITSGNVPLLEFESDNEQVVFAGNAYWNTEGQFLIKYKDKTYNSLTSWQQGTGQEKSHAKGVFTDPKIIRFRKTEKIEDARKLHTFTLYTVQQDSPLRNAGVDLTGFGINTPAKDFRGKAISQKMTTFIGTFYPGK